MTATAPPTDPAPSAAPAADRPPPPPPRPRRRGAELALLTGAVLISVCGYTVVGLTVRGAVPGGAAEYGAGLGALALVAHLAVRFGAPYADPLLLPVAVLLNGLGLVLIFRLDLATPGHRAAPAQLLWTAVGLTLFTAAVLLVRDHRRLARYGPLCAAAALVLMLAPLAFPAVNGAKIWIRLAGYSIQPGEFAKVLITVFFAARLAAHRAAPPPDGPGAARRAALRMLRPVTAVLLLTVAILVLERDLGTSLLYFCVFVVLLYVATGRLGRLVLGLLLAGAGASAVAALEPHVHGRVADWLHPFAGLASGAGPGQLAQSLYAFGAGGLLGTGLGRGDSYLIGFAMKSDFLLATFGEELGLAGLTALFLLYAILVARGFRAGLGLRDPFGGLLAVGLASLPAVQVFVIAGGVMGLIPLTGMALPFLAQGGSSLVTNWLVVALLVRLSDRSRRPGRPAPDAADGPRDTVGAGTVPVAGGAPEAGR
ncbi:FtsW/RodA/SpoVE family cell cycle protein [Streptomyces sp. NPDC002067]